MPRIDVDQAGGPNIIAFLSMLTWSELGSEVIAQSDEGYNVLVGSYPWHVLTFSSYANHPDVKNAALNSTAAGAYQQTYPDWPYYKTLLKLPDFSPLSQDLLALQHLRECRALSLITNGRIDSAIAACNHIWASLTGSRYGQPTHSLDDLFEAYKNAGGVLA